MHVVVLQFHALRGKLIEIRCAQQVVVLLIVVANIRVTVVAGGGWEGQMGASNVDGVSRMTVAQPNATAL